MKAAHRAGEDDELVEVAPLLDRFGLIDVFLGSADDKQATRALKKAEITGRPVGCLDWLIEWGRISGLTLQAEKLEPRLCKQLSSS